MGKSKQLDMDSMADAISKIFLRSLATDEEKANCFQGILDGVDKKDRKNFAFLMQQKGVEIANFNIGK